MVVYMLKKYINNKSNNSGEVMIESTIVTIIVIMILIFLIAVGFLIYQQVMMSSVANEAATAIARNYKFTSELLQTDGYSSIKIDDKYYEKIKRYRSTFNIASMKASNEQYAKEYFNDRLPVTSMSYDNDLDIETDIRESSVGRIYVTVTVSMDAQLLFDGVLSYGNFDSDATNLSASATAECLDITGYAALANYECYLSKKISENDSGLMNNVSETIDDIKYIKDKILGK